MINMKLGRFEEADQNIEDIFQYDCHLELSPKSFFDHVKRFVLLKEFLGKTDLGTERLHRIFEPLEMSP